MFKAFAVPEIVGLGFKAALYSVIFLTVSVIVFMNSSRDSGFLMSVSDIIASHALLRIIWYIKVSDWLWCLVMAGYVLVVDCRQHPWKRSQGAPLFSVSEKP